MHAPLQTLAYSSAVRGIGYSLRTGAPEADDLAPMLDEAERLGTDFVELPAYAWTLMVGGRILADRLNTLKRRLTGRPFGYTVHGPLAINLMDIPERLARHEEVLAASIDIAAELGAAHLVMHTGIVRAPDDDIEVAYSRQRDALARAGDRAQAAGILLCVENVFRFEPMRETATPSKLAGELSAIDHPAVAATLDFGHAYLRCTEARLDPVAEILALAPYAAHLHLHDNFGRPADIWVYHPGEKLAFGDGDLHLPIGWGGIDWDTITAQARIRPGAIANLELDDPYWSELPGQIPVLRALAERFMSVAPAIQAAE